MKKALLAIAAVFGLSPNASAQKAGEDNGFGIRLNVGFQGGTSYLNADAPFFGKMSEPYNIDGTSFGLTLDNRWYVWHNDKMGAAIQARWFDVNYLNGTLGYDLGFFDIDSDIDIMSINGGLLGVGPMFTWYLNDDMAIDAYYNIMPAVAYSQIKSTEEKYSSVFGTYDEVESEENYLGFGISHHIGAAFRWKVLQAGLEYRFGKIKDMEEVDTSSLSMDQALNSFRINLGVKF